MYFGFRRYGFSNHLDGFLDLNASRFISSDLTNCLAGWIRNWVNEIRFSYEFGFGLFTENITDFVDYCGIKRCLAKEGLFNWDV